MLGGTGTLLGPSLNTQFEMVVEFLKTHLPQFAEFILNANIENENGLNSQLSRFITNAAAQEIFFAERESMEDETRGDSPQLISEFTSRWRISGLIHP
jgi:homospermidine synthase